MKLGGVLFLFGPILSFGQAPEILDVIPVSGRPGDVITIEGQDFDRTATNNAVYIGNIRAKVVEASVSSLEVEVPRGVQPGTVSVAVGGFSAYSPLPFQPLFAPFGGSNACYVDREAIVSTNESFTDVESADLDGDGAAELLVIGTQNQQLRLSILQYIGGSPLISTNSFRRVLTMPISGSSPRIVPMDYDSDGRMDIVAVGNSGFRFFRNIHPQGAGPIGPRSFAQVRADNRSLQTAAKVQPVDLDRDGRIDIIAADPSSLYLYKNIYDSRSNQVTRLFADPIRITPMPGSSMTSFQAGDLNRDGHMEIVIGASRVHVYSHRDRAGILNAGSFTQIGLLTNSFINLVALGDIEGDGYLDILTRLPSRGDTVVLWNQTQGEHIATNSFPLVRLWPGPWSPTPPFNLTLFDFNGDGRLDLNATLQSYFPNQTGHLPGVIGSDAFGSVRWNYTMAQWQSTSAADVNGDGAPDLLVAPRGNSVRVLENTCGKPPVIENLLVENGLLQLKAYGTPMETVIVESSTDLRRWVRTFTLRPDSHGEGRVAIQPPSENKFYRIRRIETNNVQRVAMQRSED